MTRNTQRRMQQQAQQRQASFVPSNKMIGIHNACGGEVFYASYTPSMTFRYCDKCQLSTRKGANIELETEAQARQTCNGL
jgi:hypothetical protein